MVKGFTLVETLIYSLLVGLVLASFIHFQIGIVRSKDVNGSLLEMNAQIRAALEVAREEIGQAKTLLSVDDEVLFFEDRNGERIGFGVFDNRLAFEKQTGMEFLTGGRYVIGGNRIRIIGRDKKSVFMSFEAGQGRLNAERLAVQTAISLNE